MIVVVIYWLLFHLIGNNYVLCLPRFWLEKLNSWFYKTNFLVKYFQILWKFRCNLVGYFSILLEIELWISNYFCTCCIFHSIVYHREVRFQQRSKERHAYVLRNSLCCTASYIPKKRLNRYFSLELSSCN